MKSTCLALMLVFSVSLFGQPTTPVVNTDYLQKSKKQKTAAMLLLVGGGTLCTIALSMVASNLSGLFDPSAPPPRSNDATIDVLTVIGTAAIIGSIPLFIAAGRNKRKAASISFKLEKLPVILKQSQGNRSFPAVSFSIAFNQK